MHPELSYREFDTAEFICKYLSDNNISFRKGIAGTGIIGEIKGSAPGKRIVAIRADMDALPVTEKNESPVRSMNEGVMHACGHDAHMAMLLGASVLLNEFKDELPGTILLVFQPGEELSPGGAKLMLESGAFENPKPDIFLAQHVLPELEAGKVGYRAGRYMASSDEIYITIKGKGGHAALPSGTTDQIYIASSLIIKLKDAVRKAKEENGIPTVLGIGRIRGEGATNVIPDAVEIAGTFRTFDEKWRAIALEMIKKLAGETASEYGVSIDVRIADGYPVLVNNEKLTARAVELSTDLLGKDNVEQFDIRMGSEDFAFFTEVFPSLYFRTGVKKRDDRIRLLHTADFDLDEDGLATGTANICWIACNFLIDNII